MPPGDRPAAYHALLSLLASDDAALQLAAINSLQVCILVEGEKTGLHVLAGVHPFEQYAVRSNHTVWEFRVMLTIFEGETMIVFKTLCTSSSKLSLASSQGSSQIQSWILS